MGDPIRGLPEFPSEESSRYEKKLGPRVEPSDRFVDRFRHAWPVYTILGVLLSGWLFALVAIGLSDLGEGPFLTVLFLPLLALIGAIRLWWWSQLFSPCRKDD